MMLTVNPLLAAGFDWLEALLPFLFVAFWILSQAFAAFQRVQRGGRPAGQPDQPRRGEDIRAQLERQIEEFLRQKVEGPPRRPAAPGAPEPREDTRRAERARGQEPAAAARPRPGKAPRQPSRPAAGEGVTRHVQEAFSRELSHLSAGTIADHDDARPATTAPAERTLAADMTVLLRSPDSIRRAILMREILDRPVDRW